MNAEQKIFFTLEDIEELATSRSYARGEEYYLSGEVGKIVKKGNLFEGIVNGSRKYRVNLDITNNQLSFKCNCPYDLGGICKHNVAFALEILDGNYEENIIQDEEFFSKEEFEKNFGKASDEKKLKFLKQLLDRDANLQQQFIEFSRGVSGNLDNIVGEKIDVVKNKIHNELSSLDFSNIEDEYEYNYYDGYWGDDGLYDYAEEMIQGVFTPYISQIENYLKKGNLLDGIRITLGIYEGSQDLPELDNIDIYLFDGEYNANVQGILKESIDAIALKMDEVVKSDEAVKQLIDIIFRKIKDHCIEFDDDEGGIIYDIKDFEKIFESLIINKTTASYLLNQLQKNELEDYSASYIILNISEILNDENLWIRTAVTFSKNDEKIALRLLEKYKSQKMEMDFNRIAKMAFHNWPNEFDLYLVDNLDKEQEKSLYIDALKNYVKDKTNIKYYKQLRDYLTDDEKLRFVDDFKDSYNHVFYVQLLETEKRYKEILDCAEANTGSYTFDELIIPILNIYPSECFTFIVNKNIAAMNSFGRNRKTYQSMMKTLRLLKQITSKKEESVIFLKKLYNHKPNLPALRDEMRKANLVGDLMGK